MGPDSASLEALRAGDIEVLGRMPYSSNATFLVEIDHQGDRTRGVYKPVQGERPLWDFPPGLHQREVATYRLAAALGWRLIPPTVVRDGPLGQGSLQQFVDADFEQHYFTLLGHDRFGDQLRRLCLFDLLANSTDRKGGHLLLDTEDHIWAIDNGLTFHADLKLRTVIWDFAGEPLPPGLLDDVSRLIHQGLPPDLATLLDRAERHALVGRARAALEHGIFPHDPTGRRWPWPVV